MTAQPRLIVLAVVLILGGAGGDWQRNLIGYPAWGVVTALTLVWTLVELVRLRPRWTAIPLEVAAYLALAVLSSIWALSPWSTLAVGGGLLLLMVSAGLVLAALPVRALLGTLHWTLQGLLAGSLAFELLAELLPGERIYPVVPAPGAEYGPDAPAAFAWSRGLLFEGGRIQGIMGNANLLAMVALVALVVATARAADRVDRRWYLWTALPVVCLVLTRSSTVIVAALAVALVTSLLVARVRMPRRGFRVLLWAALACGVAGGAIIASQWTRVTALLGRDADLTGRFELWSGALGLWQQSPIVGTGYMGYWLPWVEPFDELGMFEGVLYLQAHNVWVDHLMQLGIVGVLVWAALQVRAFRNALRWARIPSAQASVPLLLLVAYLVQGLAESRPMIELGLVLLVAFAAGLARRPSLVGERRRTVSA